MGIYNDHVCICVIIFFSQLGLSENELSEGLKRFSEAVKDL